MKFSSIIKKTLSTSVLCITASFTFGQQQAANLDQLLDLVEQARLTETEEHRQRMQQFQQNVNQRQALLNEMLEREETEQRISVDLENTYNENEIIKAQRFETLQERLGDLDELFGTIAGVVGDTRSQFEASLISAQYPGREETMTELAEIMASESQLPSIE
jgi:biopolymer transport protein ExbB